MKNQDLSPKGFGRVSFLVCLLLTVNFLLFTVAACGKKGPPTLKAYEKPAAPSNLAAVHREDRILLTWSYPGGEKKPVKGFEVLRSEDSKFVRIASVESDKTTFADSDFKDETTYKYKIVVRSMKDVLSVDSNVIVVAPKRLPPVPEDIQAKVEPDSIALSWKGSAGDVCYNIYKSTVKGKYPESPLNRKPVCAASYRDSSLSPAVPVFYTVRGTLDTMIKDEGYPSPEVEVGPSGFIPSVPADVRVVAGEDKVHFVWKENPESWVKGYRIYRKMRGERDFALIGEVNTPAFTDAVKSGKKAVYLIKAVGSSAESEPLVVDAR